MACSEEMHVLGAQCANDLHRSDLSTAEQCKAMALIHFKGLDEEHYYKAYATAAGLTIISMIQKAHDVFNGDELQKMRNELAELVGSFYREGERRQAKESQG